MRPIPTRNPRVAEELQIEFVNQAGGIQCDMGLLTPQLLTRDPAQITVDQRHELPIGLFVALAAGQQELRDPAATSRVAPRNGTSWRLVVRRTDYNHLNILART
jgi:hypothetical protein